MPQPALMSLMRLEMMKGMMHSMTTSIATRMGVAMDWTMGAAGVNTIATVFIAFIRIHLLNFVCGKENVHDGGVPSSRRLGDKNFLKYLTLVVLIHNAIFFYMEALSWSHALLTLLRLCTSAAVGVLFCWLIAQLFTNRLSLRI